MAASSVILSPISSDRRELAESDLWIGTQTEVGGTARLVFLAAVSMGHFSLRIHC